MDGDGFDDLILGAVFGDGPGNTGNLNGEVVVVYGGPAQMSDIDLASPPPGVAFIYGADSFDDLGWVVPSPRVTWTATGSTT